MTREPAYTRLQVDERRRQLIAAGAAIFAEHSYEEISMLQIAETAGVSKALLYHYFPSKNVLFQEAMADAAAELQAAITPTGQGSAVEQLTASVGAYLEWVENNKRTWTKFMQSAVTLTQARDHLETFRAATMDLVLTQLTGTNEPQPVLRVAIRGWLGYMDAAILDWTQHDDLPRDALRDLLLAVFGASLFAAQQADPTIALNFG